MNIFNNPGLRDVCGLFNLNKDRQPALLLLSNQPLSPFINSLFPRVKPELSFIVGESLSNIQKKNWFVA